MPQLNLTFFGAFNASIDNEPIDAFTIARVQALLAYLALEPAQPHHRQAIAGMLWPHVSDRHALHSLRSTLHRLRRGLDEAYPELSQILLITTRQTITFHSTPSPTSLHSLHIDVIQFEHLIASSRDHAHQALDQCSHCLSLLAQAVSLYRSELLNGFYLEGAPAFDEWLLLHREMYHQRALMALQTLSSAYETRKDFDQAYTYARKLLNLDLYREDSHRRVMRLLSYQGFPDQALTQYAKCKQLLQDELEAGPSQETIELAHRIQRGELSDPEVEVERGPHSTALSTSLVDKQSLTMTAYTAADLPEVGPFFGRDSEIQQLRHWLVDDRCRLVSILGIGGIGKTSLAAHLARELASGDTFDQILWRSLLNAPETTDMLPSILQVLSDQTLSDIPESIDEQLRLLINYLRDKRVLLVLDNMESIMENKKAGVFRSGYESYAQLIQHLARFKHQGQLLLTSRERPRGFARLEKDGHLVRSLQLRGLDHRASQVLLSQRGIVGSRDAESQFINQYSGHPLALKLAADTVDEVFGGDLREFLSEEALVFDDIRDILDQQFAQLTDLEQGILFWLTIEREPTSFARLRANLLQTPAQNHLMEALRSLQRRSLIERQSEGFALQNVITEYLSDRLIEIAYQELA